jgi:hypothetical protein
MLIVDPPDSVVDKTDFRCIWIIAKFVVWFFHNLQMEGGQCEHSPVNKNYTTLLLTLRRMPVKCTCRSVDGTRQSSST